MKCVVCGSELENDFNLIAVGQTLHSGEVRYAKPDGAHCPICGLKYVDLEVLNENQKET